MSLPARDIESPDMQSVLFRVQPVVTEYQSERRSDVPVPQQVDNVVRTMNTETVRRAVYTENEYSGFTNLSEISQDVIQHTENALEEGFTMESIVPAGEGADVRRYAEEKNKQVIHGFKGSTAEKYAGENGKKDQYTGASGKNNCLYFSSSFLAIPIAS